MLAPDALTDAELLSGLWWGDQEFGPAVNALWLDYVDRMHAWEKFQSEVASALRHLHRVTTQQEQEANHG